MAINYLEHRSQFNTTQEAADDLSMAVKDYRKALRDSSEVPLSENRAKFKEDWGPKDCIQELRDMANKEPEKVITRNYFRNNSSISESTWNRYFGTFEEFKRQAGVVLTRQQHQIERDIAKHVSHDHYKVLNERHGWGESYRKDHGTKWKTILVGSDFHDVLCDPFYLRVFLDTAKRLQPTDICLNGDIYDLPEVSVYAVDPREYDPAGRIMYTQDKILKPLREACPNSNMDIIEGNHEIRLMRRMVDNNQALKILLERAHGMSTKELLGVDKFEINYISNANAAFFGKKVPVKELKRNWKTYYNTFVAHHFPPGRQIGLPGWNGHHHKHKVQSFFNHDLGSCEWHQLGAGHIIQAGYCDAKLAGWGNGFLIAHVNEETRSHMMEYVQVTNAACVGGEYYFRTEEENWEENGINIKELLSPYDV